MVRRFFCWRFYRLHLLVIATHKILVRVLNDPKNKQTFKKFRIEEFPEMDVPRECLLICMENTLVSMRQKRRKLVISAIQTKNLKLKQMMTFREHLKVANCTRMR